MKRLLRFKYPKLALLVLFSISAYYIFSDSHVQAIIDNLGQLSYLGVFLAGICFSFGFSTPFAVGFFLTVQPENIFIASIVGGMGALISDVLIFKFIRFSFMDEFKRLEKTIIVKDVSHVLSRKPFSKIKAYILYLFAGLIISSPLPDELGVSMLAGLTHVRINTLAAISFVMNTLGIFIMLVLGNSL